MNALKLAQQVAILTTQSAKRRQVHLLCAALVAMLKGR